MQTERFSLRDPGGLGIFALMAKAMMDPGWPSTGAAGREKHDAPVPAATDVAPKRGLLQRLEHWFWSQQQRDLENYLAQASDVHDLETRIRMIERRGLQAFY